MSKAPNYYIVDAEALPEIFHKVVQARRMLDTGPAGGHQPQRVL